MRREGSFRQTAKQHLDDSIHTGRSLAAQHGGVLPAYEGLLWHVQARTTLLHPSDRAGDHRNGFNAGLLALAREGGPLFLGGRSDNVANWEGRLIESAVFDRALTADEIARYCTGPAAAEGER